MVNAAGGHQLRPGLIERVSGVSTRRWRTNEQCSDLAASAAQRALANAGYGPDDVDVLMFAAVTQDIAEPATANLVQALVGCSRAHVLDVKNACTSVLNALDMARLLVSSGEAEVVLVTSGEVGSMLVNLALADMADLSDGFASLTLGDAGAALVVDRSPAASDSMVGKASFLSDGSHWRLSTVIGGGSVAAADPAQFRFRCMGAELAKVGAQMVPEAVGRALVSVGWEPCDVDLVIPHQFSAVFVEFLVKAMGFDRSSAVLTLDRFGNTGAASIPVALSVVQEEGRLQQGDRVLLVSGAAGFSAAAVPLVF